MTRLRGLLLTVPLFAIACADPPVEPDDPGVREAQVASSELMYLRDTDEVAAAFSTGAATLAPAQAFRAVDLMFTLEGALDLEYAVFTNGDWTDWAPLPVDDREGNFRAAEIQLEDVALGLALRGPSGGIEFARMEFFAARDPEHAEISFNDDLPFAESHEDETGSALDEVAEKAAREGRWMLTSAAQAASNRVHVSYDSAPSWSGGANCSGRMLDGTRRVGEYLVANFAGARYFQGYNCRQIRGSSGMSMHGTGRALDIFVPMVGTQADNDLGDPIAHWLIEHAEEIGIQLIIWDRSIWSGSRGSDKHRYYSGQHPHNDHLHIELTVAAAGQRTQFFGGNVAPPGSSPPAAAGNAACQSSTLGRQVPHGEAVQMAYDRCGGTCQWAVCSNGSWLCAEDGQGTARHANAACGVAPTRSACSSYTLGRDVPDGESVQMAYDACGGTCQWARCDDGNWNCSGAEPGSAVTHPHAECARPAEPAGASCYSRTIGGDVPDGDRVQMAYAACSSQRTCLWAVCNDGTWNCTTSAGAGADHPHAACQ
ncbi:MAG: hypothetical protein KC620_09245 [Myxococcales bacterium]|nr:hypothetical protein [Myxococcales bacterium]